MAVALAKQRILSLPRRVATIAVAVLALVMGYGVVFGHNGLTAFAHKRQEANALEQQRMQLQQENDTLREHVMRLQDNDPSTIEDQVRKDLHYTRPGEVIYTLPGAAPSARP